MNKILMSITITSLFMSLAWAQPQNQIDTKQELQKHISRLSNPDFHIAFARLVITNNRLNGLTGRNFPANEIRFYDFLRANTKTQEDRIALSKHLESLSSYDANMKFLKFVLADARLSFKEDPNMAHQESKNEISTIAKPHATPVRISQITAYISNNVRKGYKGVEEYFLKNANK